MIGNNENSSGRIESDGAPKASGGEEKECLSYCREAMTRKEKPGGFF